MKEIKIESKEELYSTIKALYSTILLSSNKKDILMAMDKLHCIMIGNCICSFCKETKSLDIVYEFSRCLVPSRLMQLIKERHCGTSRWVYVQPVYAKLYKSLYEDLDPNESVVFSNGKLENIVCRFKLSTSLVNKTLEKIAHEKIKQSARKSPR